MRLLSCSYIYARRSVRRPYLLHTLKPAEAQLSSRDALVGELRAKYEKGRETLRAAEQKHLEALERAFSESGAWVGVSSG